MSSKILGYDLDNGDKEFLVELSFSPRKQFELTNPKVLRAHDLKRLGLVTYDGKWKTTHEGEVVVEEILNEREFNNRL